MTETSELHVFDADSDPDRVVSVTMTELQDLFESGANWGESMNRTLPRSCPVWVFERVG